MNDENGKFCVSCGARLPDDATFCPQCGASVYGNPNPYQASGMAVKSQDTLGNTYMFILIYGIVAVIFGLLMAASGLSMDQQMWDQFIATLPADIADIYSAVTLEEFKSTCYLAGALFVGSGACALVSSFFVKSRTKWIVALVMCLVASLLSVEMIITLIIGLFMTFKIYVNKNVFSN